MCGRYTIAKPKRVVAVFAPRIVKADLSRPRYNIAPMQKVPIVTGQGNERTLMDCQWGLVPGWAKDPAIGSRMINARIETVAEKPAYRTAFRDSRCLIPADGFYEWQKTPSGKHPFWIHTKDGEPFAFAGLYTMWKGGKPGQILHSCVILTMDADDFMAPVHDRMPVILPESLWEAWSDPSPQATGTILQRILSKPDRKNLTMTRVSSLVNSPLNDSEQCIVPAGDEPAASSQGELL